MMRSAYERIRQALQEAEKEAEKEEERRAEEERRDFSKPYVDINTIIGTSGNYILAEIKDKAGKRSRLAIKAHPTLGYRELLRKLQEELGAEGLLVDYISGGRMGIDRKAKRIDIDDVYDDDLSREGAALSRESKVDYARFGFEIGTGRIERAILAQKFPRSAIYIPYDYQYP
jgi:hypothetical protein